MATYRLFFTQTASSCVEVEADDLDEALDLAYEELPGDVCAYCSGMGNDGNAGIELGGDWQFDETSYYVDDIETGADQ